MHVNAAKLVYFSPTQTTKRVLVGIAEGLALGSVTHIDLTPPSARTQAFDELYDELALFGAPVYGGRVPLEAVQRIRRIKGNDTPAVVVVVYGNREYEDALLELRDLVTECGFRPVAGAAFVGEHSFSDETTPLSKGRPDREDARKAAGFGRMVQEKLGTVSAAVVLSDLQVPGEYPYKEREQPSDIAPITQKALCGKCGTCASVCPTAAITVNDTVETDGYACILCCACVKNCPTGAREMDNPLIQRTREWLRETCRVRKEPQLFV
jgi:ferredoxin